MAGIYTKYQRGKRLTIPTGPRLKKTEGAICYEFPEELFTDFVKWSSRLRDHGEAPTFKKYYSLLPNYLQQVITVTVVSRF
jgi:hypothetical protein